MCAKKIRQDNYGRVLITEIAPFETPLNFSYWGSYRLIKDLGNLGFIQNLVHRPVTIPYKYRVRKDIDSFRNLSVVHPHAAWEIVRLYESFDAEILKHCSKSQFTLRAPHSVAKRYRQGPSNDGAGPETIEELNSDTLYASSYFAYNRYSHLYKFFDSDEFTELEKRYKSLSRLDIGKCFPSLYTHSISWAIRGKATTKRLMVDSLALKLNRNAPPLDHVFDRALMNLNYGETHGIPIGPEFCRVFAEIILQTVDVRVSSELYKHGYEAGRDYECRRYIDDYFIFFNSPEVAIRLRDVLIHELEKYRLFLNDEKAETFERPFISHRSVLKIELSSFLSDIGNRSRSPKTSHELNKLRAILKKSPRALFGGSLFFLKSVRNRIEKLSKETTPDLLYTYTELACYAMRMEPSVSPIFEFARVILSISAKLSNLEDDKQSEITDKLRFELRNSILATARLGYSVECANLLLIATHAPLTGTINRATLDQVLVELEKNMPTGELRNEQRLGYFEIVCLLYVAGPIGHREMINHLFKVGCDIISRDDPGAFAESFCLLMDFCTCPHLSNTQKIDVLERAGRHLNTPASSASCGRLLSAIGSGSWFFDWNQRRDLSILLKKRELRLSY